MGHRVWRSIATDRAINSDGYLLPNFSSAPFLFFQYKKESRAVRDANTSRGTCLPVSWLIWRKKKKRNKLKAALKRFIIEFYSLLYPPGSVVTHRKRSKISSSFFFSFPSMTFYKTIKSKGRTNSLSLGKEEDWKILASSLWMKQISWWRQEPKRFDGLLSF